MVNVSEHVIRVESLGSDAVRELIARRGAEGAARDLGLRRLTSRPNGDDLASAEALAHYGFHFAPPGGDSQLMEKRLP